MSFRSTGRFDGVHLLRSSTFVAASVLLATSFAPEARAQGAKTNNWNQWNDDARDGVVQGMTKLALGADYALVGPSEHTVRLSLEVEHLLRDRWGIVGDLALPLQGEWVAPATIGIRFHFIPKFPLDPFLGLAGGVAWLAPDTLASVAAPIAEARAGLAFHYFGLFFVQIEAGYDFVRYGRDGVTLDVGGASFSGRLGVSF